MVYSKTLELVAENIELNFIIYRDFSELPCTNTNAMLLLRHYDIIYNQINFPLLVVPFTIYHLTLLVKSLICCLTILLLYDTYKR